MAASPPTFIDAARSPDIGSLSLDVLPKYWRLVASASSSIPTTELMKDSLGLKKDEILLPLLSDDFLSFCAPEKI